MQLLVMTEEPKNRANLNRVVDILTNLKKKYNSSIDINVEIVKSALALRSFKPKDNQFLVCFGATLYKNLTSDINKYFNETGLVDIQKFSFFVRSNDINYFIAFMPTIDFCVEKPETFIAFEAMMKSLEENTSGFTTTPRELFESRLSPDELVNPVSVIKNGATVRTKCLSKYEDIRDFLTGINEYPEGHVVCLDTETTGLDVFGENFNVTILSACFDEPTYTGYSLDIGLPGLPNSLTKNEYSSIESLMAEYIFGKKKTVYGWNTSYDVFASCNKFRYSYKDFLASNRVVDGAQILHLVSENRKVESYKLKAALRDYLNFEHYDYMPKYLEYIRGWKEMSPLMCIERAINAMNYAAKDASGCFQLTKMLLSMAKSDTSIDMDVIDSILKIKIELEGSGWNVDAENLLKKSMGYSGWEIDNIVKPVLKSTTESKDGRLHTSPSLVSATTGRLYYKKPNLNALKINTPLGESFLADDDSYMVYLDMTAAEPCMLAFLAQDKVLMEDLYNNEDYYEFFAKKIFGKDEITPEDRKISKKFVLSMINLSYKTTIAKDCGITESDAENLISIFYDRYKNVSLLKEQVKDFFRKNKYIVSGMGRKRRFSEADMVSEQFIPSFLKAHNHPIQSTMSDHMVYTAYKFLSSVEKCKILYFNHDAVAYNIPNSSTDALEKIRMFENTTPQLREGVKNFRKAVCNDDCENFIDIKFKFKTLIGTKLSDMKEVNPLGELSSGMPEM